MDQIASLSQVALGFISAAAVARPFLASTALALPYLAQLAEQQVKRKTEKRKRTNVPWKNGGWKIIHFLLKWPGFSLGDMFVFGGVTRLGQGRLLKNSTCNPRYFFWKIGDLRNPSKSAEVHMQVGKCFFCLYGFLVSNSVFLIVVSLWILGMMRNLTVIHFRWSELVTTKFCWIGYSILKARQCGIPFQNV